MGKVKEKLSSMEAKLKNGEGDEKLGLKVELVRKKVDRYYFLMHLLFVSKNPEEFADCSGNLNNNMNDNEVQFGEKSEAENVERIQYRAIQSSEDVEDAKEQSQMDWQPLLRPWRRRERRRANRESYQALIQLSQKAYALFVEWKGNGGKG